MPITVSSETVNQTYIDSMKTGLLALGRSSYPDVAFALFFDTTMSDAGFTKRSANGIDLYEYSEEDAAVIIARDGNVIYAAVSQFKDVAERLVLSCF